MKKEHYEKGLICPFIELLLVIFKWVNLMACVVCVGLTIGLLMMNIVKGDNLPNSILASMVHYITSYNEAELLSLIGEHGRMVVVVAGAGYGLASSISYGLVYVIISKFRFIFQSIKEEKMFTKENLAIIDEMIPLTIFLAFANPVIIYCIALTTPMFSEIDVNTSGIVYICVVYILKMIFEYGYSLEVKINKSDNEGKKEIKKRTTKTNTKKIEEKKTTKKSK